MYLSEAIETLNEAFSSSFPDWIRSVLKNDAKKNTPYKRASRYGLVYDAERDSEERKIKYGPDEKIDMHHSPYNNAKQDRN